MDARRPLDALSEEQTEILINFQNLSGLDDINQCRRILEHNGWDEQAAVENIFREQDDQADALRRQAAGLPSIARYSSNYRREASMAQDGPTTSANPARTPSFQGGPAPVVPWGLWDWMKAIVVIPVRFTYTTIVDFLRFLWSFVAGPSFPASTPTQDVKNFIEGFEEMYGTTHPVFYQGGYKEAYQDAKRELRFLLLYLHQDNSHDSDRFCRDALIHPNVVSMINSRALFWGCSTKYAEGYKVAQALQVSKYPSLGLIANKGNQMTLIGRLQGYHNHEQLIDKLTQLFGHNERLLNAARQERQQLDMNQTLRKEQDEAFQKSLKADQDKAEKKRQEALKKEQAEHAKKEAEERKHREEIERVESLARRKHEAARLVPAEPKEGTADCCRISFKLPNGKRIQRRFNDTDVVADLYHYILSQPDVPDQFEVYTTYPRNSIECSPASRKEIELFGWGPAIALIVEEKEEADDEELDKPIAQPV
ncbi:hypothetical protein RvY_18473-2 [Ramazzottius varieornatus]|uniref:UBX domain-containing protein n=1 Tax=Ramazzottius varieornatus TaxID=947166 RepID=A0A1D1W961_RAMVA|nr:hypothetical protein RvY_18473-2 [Ramazzottius varieornatus]